ncbi:MAG TPA: histidine kinase N-terminal domain-containing protein [Actinomycetales bacterium]|nr:histidine kinase N-terminal domain-containing protein [Actinomycetales bacterium]
MPTLNDLVRRHADLAEGDREWLHLLVGDWQLLSDLSFADLVLWLPLPDGAGYVAVAHCRPSTGPTVFYDDQVGARLATGRRPQVDLALAERRICRERDPEWMDDVPVREETIPVVRDGRVVAVLARHTNLAAARTPSRLELSYLQCADALARMIATGDFPTAGAPTGMRRGAPRVGDGLVRLDVEGTVVYASPNALADYHRLGLVGDLVGSSLAEVTSDLVTEEGQVDEALPLVVTGRAPWRTDVESGGVALSLRAIPLTADGVRSGAIVLCRDVSELRRRELELLSKDATIREIHHRVKNNLQTVAALLRLQGRRLGSGEARAALEEATRRVATIALVHETLSRGFDEAVDLDEVVDSGLALAAEVAATSDGARAVREGSFGTVQAQDATPLALVLTELVTNAFEHGLHDRQGTVRVQPRRDGERLEVLVTDDGVGLPADLELVDGVPSGGGLGTQIVTALVAGELRGSIAWGRGADGGTCVRVEARLHEPPSR